MNRINSMVEHQYRKKKLCAKAILIKEKEGIYFIKASMSAKTKFFYFKNGMFLIENAKVVDKQIAIQLKRNLLIFN